MTKVTALYARVSTQKQAEEGYSIEAQKEKLHAYAKVKDWLNTKEYIDGGFSGAKLDRPAIQKLIADVKAHKVERVVVLKLDRLSRSQKDTLYLIEDVFDANDVDFVSLNENIETHSAYGKLMIGILSAFAQLERENIFYRTRIGMEKRLEQGKWRGGGSTPFGYDYDKSKETLVPNEKADIVKAIYRDYLNGDSPNKIYKRYNLSGDKLVTNILTHRVYTGVIEHKGKVLPGLHEAIISEEIFDLVQLRLAERSTKARATTNNTNLLTGIIYCGYCGSRMRYVKWSKGKYKLACYSYADKAKTYMHNGECNFKHIDASAVEEAVINDLFNISVNLTASPDYKIQNAVNPLKKLKKDVEVINNKLDKLLDLYFDSTFTKEELEAKRASLMKEKALLEETIRIEEKTNQKKNNILLIVNQVASIKENWGNFNDKQKQAIVRACIKEIKIFEDKIEINYQFDIKEVQKQAA